MEADYSKTLALCKNFSDISSRVIDNFLLNYIDEKEKISKKFTTQLLKYRDIINDFPDNWLGMTAAQYIAHKMLRENGLLIKYIGKQAIQKRNEDEKYFLEYTLDNPWKFSLCHVQKEINDSYFELFDFLTQTTFQLYSTGVKQFLTEFHNPLFLILCGYNGRCHQTYGPILYFKGFQPYDFIYFSQLQHKKDSTIFDVKKRIEMEPLPFLLLLKGSNIPAVYNGKYQLVHCMSELKIDNFSISSNEFSRLHKNSIVKYSLGKWADPPHFASAYFNKNNQKLRITSLTEEGFLKIVKKINTLGYQIITEPQYKATLPMISTAMDILKKNLFLNEYDKLFEEKPSESENQELARLNCVLKKLSNAFNKGEKYDIEQIACECGIDPENARQAEKMFKDATMKNLPNL